MTSSRDMNGLVWYHALCMDLLLDTCYSIKSYDECAQFYNDELVHFQDEGRTEATSRFLANLSLWCARHENHEASQTWIRNLSTCFSLEPKSSMNNMFTGLRVIEGLSLQLVFAIEGRSAVLTRQHDEELQKVVHAMRLTLKVCSRFEERFELHLTHLSLIKNCESDQLKKLAKLSEKAIKSQDYYACDLIKHNLRSWRSELPPAIKHFWAKHSKADDALELTQITYSDRVFPYSLPIPTSGNF